MQQVPKSVPIKLKSLREARENVKSSSKPPGILTTLLDSFECDSDKKITKNKTPLNPRYRIMESPKIIHNNGIESNITLIKKASAVKEAFEKPIKTRISHKDLKFKKNKTIIAFSTRFSETLKDILQHTN
jgi:hypothetical protein